MLPYGLHMPWLRIEDATGSRQVQLPEGPSVVGRLGGTADIQIDHRALSRRHVEITVLRNQASIRDLDLLAAFLTREPWKRQAEANCMKQCRGDYDRGVRWCNRLKGAGARVGCRSYVHWRKFLQGLVLKSLQTTGSG